MRHRSTAVVVPCYDEVGRLNRAELLRLAQRDGLNLILVDDGSSDGTVELIAELVADGEGSISAVWLPENQGKAEAVRQGLLRAGSEFHVVGYLDADLSTPVDEMLRLVDEFARWDVDVMLGSRVALAGRDIYRHRSRHYLGRVFATVASSFVLGEVIYDTQCGAKLFKNSPLLRESLANEFTSRWSFDVELLGRLLQGTPTHIGIPIDRFREEPLRIWHDVPGSKIDPVTMVVSGLDLFSIQRALRRRQMAFVQPTGSGPAVAP